MSPTLSHNFSFTMSGGTERLRQPPATCVGQPNGLITKSDPSGYTKRQCKVTRLVGDGCSGSQPSALAVPLFRWARVAIGLID